MAMKRVSMLLLGIATIAGLGGGAPSAKASGELPRLVPRALAYREITLGGMPSTTWASGGLWTVGKGETIYLQAEVLKSSVVTGVDWTLTSVPLNSTASIGSDVLPATLGLVTPGDAAVYSIAGRKTLIPDLDGQYGIKAVVHTTKGDITLTAQATAGVYVGVGRELDAAGNTVSKNAKWPQCALCHAVTDKIDEWQKTGHATKLIREISGLGSDHYGPSCVKCHTVGYNSTPSVQNGGFDDVAKLLNWTFPVDGSNPPKPILAPASWADMPPALKNVSNIQCENCHGAGSQHQGDAQLISVAQDVGVCAQCHDQPANHAKVAEWRLSGHANAVTSPTGPGRESCAQCHSTTGFMDYVAGKPEAERRTSYAGITCSTCHDPHSDANPGQLRTVANVTLRNGEVITDGDNGKLCMNCHMSRVDVATYVATSAGSSRFGPHHGPQTDMIAGTNAVEYGKFIPSTQHLVAVGEACMGCHMQNLAGDATAVPPIPPDPAYASYLTGPAPERYTHAGGHTWKMTWDKNATPDDVADDIDETRVCSNCHGAVAKFDKPTRKDFDGNGVAEGVQTEIGNLLTELGMLLPPIGQPTVTITSAYTKQQLKAAFNYQFVVEDKSQGVHNAAYAAGILKASIEDLNGSAADPLLGGASVGNGWYLSPVYGYYQKLENNWIFHENLGMLLVETDWVSGYVFLWNPAIGTWMSTNDAMYPMLYFYDGQGLMLFSNNEAPDLWFYRQLDAQWIYYPGFDLNPTNMYP